MALGAWSAASISSRTTASLTGSSVYSRTDRRSFMAYNSSMVHRVFDATVSQASQGVVEADQRRGLGGRGWSGAGGSTVTGGDGSGAAGSAVTGAAGVRSSAP